MLQNAFKRYFVPLRARANLCSRHLLSLPFFLSSRLLLESPPAFKSTLGGQKGQNGTLWLAPLRSTTNEVLEVIFSSAKLPAFRGRLSAKCFHFLRFPWELLGACVRTARDHPTSTASSPSLVVFQKLCRLCKSVRQLSQKGIGTGLRQSRGGTPAVYVKDFCHRQRHGFCRQDGPSFVLYATLRVYTCVRKLRTRRAFCLHEQPAHFRTLMGAKSLFLFVVAR